MARSHSMTRRHFVGMIVAASLAACPTFGNLGVIQSARGEKERNVSPDDVVASVA